MKKSVILLFAALVSAGSNSQVRTSLLEEFTGENCMPCAAYNPALDVLLAQPANAAKIIALKWQVPIPTTPFNPASLYQTNKAEIDWRYSGLGIGYGYQCKSTPTALSTDGVSSAPTCLIDGQNQWTFGVPGNHPYYLNSAAISNAAAVSTPFSINMATSWNSTFSNCAVTVTVTSSTAFTAQGNLVFRLCLVERYIEFQSSPGTNGEKKFHDVVRQSYPVTTSGGVVTGMGTALPAAWTAAQQQVFVVSCAIPSHIKDLSQMAFVGFVQDDGDRKIYQAARTSKPPIPNDAQAGQINIPLIVCTTTVQPSITISNNGPNAITDLTITPVVDGVSAPNVTWTGTLPPSASTTIPMSVLTTAAGSHTYAYSISGVSGGDIVTINNQNETTFMNASSYFPAPFTEGFESAAFPPANWLVSNIGGSGNFEWSPIVGGFGNSSHSAVFHLYRAMLNESPELYLPPADLVGTLNSELSFDLAYQGQQAVEDSLFVLVSSDCGNTWKKAYSNGGDSMFTAPYAINAGFYAASSEWITEKIQLAPFVSSSQVLIKFQLKSDHGNGLYIDNVNLKAGTGNPPVALRELNDPAFGFSIYPNPANRDVSLYLTGQREQTVKVEIQNAAGQIVFESSQMISPGENRITVDCSSYSPGIYAVKVDSGSGSITNKLMIAGK